jgi:hypothetical protein
LCMLLSFIWWLSHLVCPILSAKGLCVLRLRRNFYFSH